MTTGRHAKDVSEGTDSDKGLNDEFTTIPSSAPTSDNSRYRGKNFIPSQQPSIPVENRLNSAYVIREKLGANSNEIGVHAINTVVKANSDSDSVHFFKEDRNNQPMSEVEAFLWECLHHLTPDLVAASAHAIYEYIGNSTEHFQYVGFVSKAIPHFKPSSEVPLTEEMIWGGAGSNSANSIFNHPIDMSVFERLSNRYAPYPEFDETHLDGHHIETVSVTSSKFDPVTGTNIDYTYQIDIKAEHIKAYRITRGVGGGTAARYLHNEDDFHQNNCSAHGHQLDFGKLEAKIVSTFDNSNVASRLYRNSTVGERLKFTAGDIKRLPVLTESQPYYFPSIPTDTFRYCLTRIGQAFDLANATNPWSAKASAVYQQLEKHSVSIYHKYRILLKAILTDPMLYKHMAALHIRSNLCPNAFPHSASSEILGSRQTTPFIDIFAEMMEQRINEITELLCQIPEFATFLQKDGISAMEIILDEITVSNNKYLEKIEKAKRNNDTAKMQAYQNLIIDKDVMCDKYKNLVKRVTKSPPRPLEEKSAAAAAIPEKVNKTLSSPLLTKTHSVGLFKPVTHQTQASLVRVATTPAAISKPSVVEPQQSGSWGGMFKHLSGILWSAPTAPVVAPTTEPGSPIITPEIGMGAISSPASIDAYNDFLTHMTTVEKALKVTTLPELDRPPSPEPWHMKRNKLN